MKKRSNLSALFLLWPLLLGATSSWAANQNGDDDGVRRRPGDRRAIPDSRAKPATDACGRSLGAELRPASVYVSPIERKNQAEFLSQVLAPHIQDRVVEMALKSINVTVRVLGFDEVYTGSFYIAREADLRAFGLPLDEVALRVRQDGIPSRPLRFEEMSPESLAQFLRPVPATRPRGVSRPGIMPPREVVVADDRPVERRSFDSMPRASITGPYSVVAPPPAEAPRNVATRPSVRNIADLARVVESVLNRAAAQGPLVTPVEPRRRGVIESLPAMPAETAVVQIIRNLEPRLSNEDAASLGAALNPLFEDLQVLMAQAGQPQDAFLIATYAREQVMKLSGGASWAFAAGLDVFNYVLLRTQLLKIEAMTLSLAERLANDHPDIDLESPAGQLLAGMEFEEFLERNPWRILPVDMEASVLANPYPSLSGPFSAGVGLFNGTDFRNYVLNMVSASQGETTLGALRHNRALVEQASWMERHAPRLSERRLPRTYYLF